MPDPIVYLNGQFLPQSQAMLPINDRGTQFGDGVYDVVRYFAQQPFAMQAHQDRLARSLRQIHLDPLPCFDALPKLSAQLLEHNGLSDAIVYWQITRSPAQANRDRLYPETLQHHVLLTATLARSLAQEQTACPATCCLHPDQRWARCDIKTLNLLPSVLAKNHAHRLGYDDALLHRGNTITEATAANLFLIAGDTLQTHPCNHHILPGINRQIVIDLARSLKLNLEETSFSIAALLQADGAFLTGTTTLLRPISTIDSTFFPTDHPILSRLRQALLAHIADKTKLPPSSV